MENVLAQRFNAKSLLRFTTPSMIMMVFVAVYVFVGNIFAANYLGDIALAAIGIVFPYASVVLAVAIMYATGANAIISANLGEQKDEVARQKFTFITIAGLVTGIAFAIVTLVFDDQILAFLGSTEMMNEYAKPYLQMYAFVFLVEFFDVFALFFFVTIGKPQIGLIGVLVGGVANILVVFLSLAVFEMGIIGVSLGMFVGYLVPTLLFLFYFTFKRNNALYFVKPKKYKGFMFHTCTNGSSEMVTNLATAIIAGVMNAVMLKLVGENGVSAVTIVGQLQFLLSSIFIGFGAGIAPIFGYAYGANDHEQTKTVFKISTRIVAIASVALAVLCFFFTDAIVSIFLDNNSPVYPLAKSGVSLFSIALLFMGSNIFASVFFTSVSNGPVSALISFMRTFVFILGALLTLPLIWGTTGVWIATPMAEALAIIVSVLLLKKYRKRYHY